MTTPDNAMIDPMPELDIDTAGHTGIRIRGYSVERVKALLDRIASLEAELEHANQWRDLALQFDGHRMQALGHLKAMRKDPFKHCDAAGEFLAAPPLPGEAVLAERLAQLSLAQAVPTEGWKLVPIRPTDEMIAAAHESDREYSQRAFGGAMHMPQGGEDHWSAMLAASPTPPARKECWCTTCRPITLSDMRFVVCPDCGNKRCPKANHHDNACTNSNAPGQPGSRWEHVRPHGIQGEGNE